MKAEGTSGAGTSADDAVMGRRQLRAIVYGLGSINILATRYMIEKGMVVVGAVDTNPSLTGRDVGDVVGLGRKIGVAVSDDAEKLLATSHHADIAVMSVCSTLQDLYPHIWSCVDAGLNVITPAEEALYPWVVAPAAAHDLHLHAQRRGVTITGAGGQDSFRVNMVTLLSGACQSANCVFLTQTGVISQLGPASVKNYFLGKDPAALVRAFPGGQPGVFSLKVCVDAVIADLGLTASGVKLTVSPIIAHEDLHVPAVIGGVVPKGQIAGLIKTAHVQTAEGIEFHAKQISTAVGGGANAPTSISECRIEGRPGLKMRVEATDYEAHSAAAASMVNRIPDVLNAASGFVTVDALPKLRYRSQPLHYYAKLYHKKP